MKWTYEDALQLIATLQAQVDKQAEQLQQCREAFQTLSRCSVMREPHSEHGCKSCKALVRSMLETLRPAAEYS